MGKLYLFKPVHDPFIRFLQCIRKPDTQTTLLANSAAIGRTYAMRPKTGKESAIAYQQVNNFSAVSNCEKYSLCSATKHADKLALPAF